MINNAAGEATKKRPVFGRLLSLSATYFQGSAMAAAGEWRDEVGSSKLTSVLLKVPSAKSAHISTHTEATQTLLTRKL